METENERDLFDSYFEFIIFEIDRDNQNIARFDDDNLFMNIYTFYCFCRYLSPYYEWEKEAMERLKQNIIKKWPANDFCNVFLFVELLSHGCEKVDPTYFFWKSEDYFEYLITQKNELNRLVRDRHLYITKNKKVKCIR